jgi:hypothetical protein
MTSLPSPAFPSYTIDQAETGTLADATSAPRKSGKPLGSCPGPIMGPSTELAELKQWLGSVDQAYMTSRALHGADWEGFRIRHLVISAELAHRLRAAFASDYSKPMPVAKILAKLAMSS